MATLTDRPQRKREPPKQPSPGREPPPRAPRAHSPRTTRLLGAAYLLAPLTAAIAGLFAVAAVAVAIALSIGSGVAPPATGSATLVPSDALLYLHVSTDPSRASVRQAMGQIRRLPGAPLLFAAVTARLDALLSGSSSATVDYGTDVRPWLGRDAAFAVLDTPGPTAGTLIVLDVRNQARARAFLAVQGVTPDGTYRKVQLLQQPSGAVLAFLGHYLVLGQASSVLAAINVAAGREKSLAASTAYERAAAGEPPDRVLDFYAPAAGIRRALVPRQGLLGALGVLLDQPALSAAAVAVSPSAGGFSVVVHSTLDPKLARIRAYQSRQLTPSLASVLPPGTLMLLDAGNLRRAAPKLLAAAAKVGIAGRTAALFAQLGSALTSEGVNLNRLFAIFGNQAAFAIVPGRDSGPAPVLVGRTLHPAAARAELAGLEGPLMQAFTPPTNGTGMVPEVAATTIAGVTVSELTLAPGFQLDWSVSNGLVVLSTSAGAIARVIDHGAALGREPAYRAATRAFPSQVTSLVFFDLSPLLRLGSRLGLIGSTTLQSLSSDLEQIRAIGLESTRGESDTTTELQLQIR